MILLFIEYVFASVGMALYGGREFHPFLINCCTQIRFLHFWHFLRFFFTLLVITRDPANPLAYILLEAEDFVDNNYWANNFNDMFSGMNVLFNLLVVNNWTECEIGFEYVTGEKWVRIFFFSFHLIGVIVISNVVTSFIINAYFQQMKTLVQRLGWEEIIENEALLKGARGIFDATTSTYFMWIRGFQSDCKIDE